MRGEDVRTEYLLSCVCCEVRVPQDHPLRAIGANVDEARKVLPPELTGRIRASAGRRSRRRSSCGRCCCKPMSGALGAVP